MNTKSTIFITFITVLIILAGCNKNVSREEAGKSRTTALKEKVEHQIRKDEPKIANLVATYGISFVNHKENNCWKDLWNCKIMKDDDFYIRKDVAKIFYGYSLNNSEITIKEADGLRILIVKLPEPKQIQKDRTTISSFSNYDDYKPVVNGEPVNIENHINKELDGYISKYEEITIGRTKEMTRNYFEAIAKKFNLKLQIEFSGKEEY